MEGGIMYDITAWLFLVTIGIYHVFSTTRDHLKSPTHYSAKPYHPFSISLGNNNNKLTKHTQLYLTLIALTAALIHQLIISSEPDPLLKGRSPVHLFTSLQSASVLFLFLILTLALLLSDTTSLLPLPNDLFFALASAAFYLSYSVSSSTASVQTSDLQSHCDTLSAHISALSSLLCLLLACFPRLFIADIALGASLCLQGLWALQTGLSLHVDAFIPEGCHKLLDVVSGVEGSTKCDLEDSRLRAVAVLDLLFVVHVMIVVVVVMVIYAAIAKTVSSTTTSRRFGSYEALPTVGVPPSSSAAAVANVTAADSSHIQMKALAGTQA